MYFNLDCFFVFLIIVSDSLIVSIVLFGFVVTEQTRNQVAAKFLVTVARSQSVDGTLKICDGTLNFLFNLLLHFFFYKPFPE